MRIGVLHIERWVLPAKISVDGVGWKGLIWVGVACGSRNVSVHIDLRPEISGGGLRRNDHVCIVNAERQVDAARAYIAHRRCKVRQEVPLDVRVALHHVTSMWRVFDVSTPQ